MWLVDAPSLAIQPYAAESNDLAEEHHKAYCEPTRNTREKFTLVSDLLAATRCLERPNRTTFRNACGRDNPGLGEPQSPLFDTTARKFR